MLRRFFLIAALLAGWWPAVGLTQQADSARLTNAFFRGFYLWKNDHQADSALVIGQRVAQESRQLKFPLGESYGLMLSGYGKQGAGDNEGARTDFTEALNIRKRLGIDSLTIGALLALGTTEASPEQAISTYRQAERLAMATRDTLRLSYVYANMANAWDLKNAPDTALFFNKLALDLAHKTNDPDAIALNAYGLGKRLNDLYFRDQNPGDLAGVRDNFTLALNEYRRAKNTRGQADALNALGALGKYLPKEYSASKLSLETSLDLYREKKDTMGMMNAWFNLVELERSRNHPDAAARAFEQLNQLLKATGLDQDEDFLSYFFNQGTVYQGQVLEQIQILKNESLASSATVMKYAFMGLLLVCAFFAFVIFQNLRAQTMKEKLHNQAVEKLVQQSRIQVADAQIESADKERERFAGRLHNGVGSFMYAAKWNLESALKQAEKTGNPLAPALRENLSLQLKAYE